MLPPKVSKAILRLLLWRPQLSHLVVLMACLLLSLRLNHLIEYFDEDKENDPSHSPLNLGQPVLAETNSKEPSAQEPPEQESPPESDEEDSLEETVKDPPKASPPSPTASSGLTQEAPAPLESSTEKIQTNEEDKLKFDSLYLDENQVRVFKALSDRHDKIDQQSEQVEQQRKLIELGEKKLSEQINSLQEMKKSIEEAKQSLTKEEENNLNKMIKIYEGMKPEEAAEIFNKMHVVVVSKLIQGMNQKKAAPILAAMDKNKARMVTLEMIRPKEAPHPIEEESAKTSINSQESSKS